MNLTDDEHAMLRGLWLDALMLAAKASTMEMHEVQSKRADLLARLIADASGAASTEMPPATLPLQRALMRLLWNSVADDADCTCATTDICPECEAMAALGLERWHNATAADYALGAMEQRLNKEAT